MRSRPIKYVSDIRAICTRPPYRRCGKQSLGPPHRSLGARYDISPRYWHIAAETNIILPGCLLFSAFEWEPAAELFAQLSRSIPVELYSTLCLLNAAIIHARLGQFSNAAQALEDVEHVEELLPITLCLMGHVEYELGSFNKSEDCFNIALGAVGQIQGYNHLGLNFVLREEQIQQNLKVLQTPTRSGMVATIPGDVLAEAPPRDTGSSMSTGCRGTRQWSIHSASTTESLDSRPVSAITTVAPLVPKAPPLDSRVEVHSERAKPQHVVLASASTSGSANPKATDKNGSPLPFKMGKIVTRYSRLRAAGKKMLSRRLSFKKAPEKVADKIEVRSPVKRIQRMEARDPRPGGNTTADLSLFIKNLPKQNGLVARDARGRPGSTGDLAGFFRDTDPENIEAATTMISRDSIESTLLPDSEPGSYDLAGLSNPARRTTLSSEQSQNTQQDGLATPADETKTSSRHMQYRVSSSGPWGNEVSKHVPERSATFSSNRTWQSQDGSDSWPPNPQRYQPQAVHPSIRPGFSLDGQ